MDFARLQGDMDFALSQPEDTMPTSIGPTANPTKIERFHAQLNVGGGLAYGGDADWFWAEAFSMRVLQRKR